MVKGKAKAELTHYFKVGNIELAEDDSRNVEKVLGLLDVNIHDFCSHALAIVAESYLADTKLVVARDRASKAP